MPFDWSIAGKPSPRASLHYGWKDTVLYALGVGAKKDELEYLSEARGGPKVLPSFAVVPKFQPMLDMLALTGGDMNMIVHGGERVLLHGTFAAEATVATTATIRGFYDMRRLAQVLIDTETRDAAGHLLAETTSSMLFRDAGGFGGEPPPKERPRVERPKDIAPTFTIEEVTLPEQALLYRLSGDHNPLHSDPELARAVGFERGPILHGLCSLGFMVRHAARGACGGDATRLRAFEGQFRRPVWPGDTLVTHGWLVAPGELALQVKVKERDEIVIAGAWATFV